MKSLKIIGIVAAVVIGGIIALGIVGLGIIGSMAPETHVYLERQIPKDYIETIKSLGLLEEDEKIKYFYTDGFLDIEDGMYFVTDRKLVVYCKDWEEPATMVRFEELIDVRAEYNPSFFEDSAVFVETDELLVEFPLSSDRGRDKVFVEYLMEMWHAATGGLEEEEGIDPNEEVPETDSDGEAGVEADPDVEEEFEVEVETDIETEIETPTESDLNGDQ